MYPCQPVHNAGIVLQYSVVENSDKEEENHELVIHGFKNNLRLLESYFVYVSISS